MNILKEDRCRKDWWSNHNTPIRKRRKRRDVVDVSHAISSKLRGDRSVIDCCRTPQENGEYLIRVVRLYPLNSLLSNGNYGGLERGFGASVGHLVLGLEYMSDGVPPELDVLIVEYSMAVSGFRLLTHRHYIEHRTSMLAESVQLIVEGLFESGWPLVFTNIEKTQDIIRQMIESGEAPPSYSRLP